MTDPNTKRQVAASLREKAGAMNAFGRDSTFRLQLLEAVRLLESEEPAPRVERNPAGKLAIYAGAERFGGRPLTWRERLAYRLLGRATGIQL